MENKSPIKSNNAAIESRVTGILEVLDINIAVLDHSGIIIATNQSWRKFAANNCAADGSLPHNIGEGSNYLEICRNAFGPSAEGALVVCEGLRAILDGKSKAFYHEYPCHSPNKNRWFSMKAKPIRRTKPREVVVMHEDITDRTLAEMESQSRQRALSDALRQLQMLTIDISHYLNLPRSPLPNSAVTNSLDNSMQDKELLRMLSIREIEVLKGLIRGERNGAIAQRLGLSVKSVSTYRSRILKKLKLDTNLDLVAFTSKVGFL
jgi:DNA-binding CsgD family transcriptional regulator